jgi:hypothetical protein
MVGSLTNQIARLSQPDVIERLVAAAALLALARCVGRRACHATMWPSDDVLSRSSDGDVLPDPIAEAGRDSIRDASSKDLLFAVGVEPYTWTASKAAPANKRSVAIVPRTDSVLSMRPRAAAFVEEASPAALQRTHVPRAVFHVQRSQEPRAVRCRGLP